MVWQSFFSVVRLTVLSLLSVGLSACTAQHTRDISHRVLQDIGLKRSVVVARTGHWSLPPGAAVYLAPAHIIGTDQESYPRLRSQLDDLLAALVAERFQGRVLQEEAVPGPSAGVLLRVGLAAANDRLSSAAQKRSGTPAAESGHDQLRLVMKVYDVGSGQLLDTLSAEAISGWRWKEHYVKELAEPTLRAMLVHLHGAQPATAMH